MQVSLVKMNLINKETPPSRFWQKKKTHQHQKEWQINITKNKALIQATEQLVEKDENAYVDQAQLE